MAFCPGIARGTGFLGSVMDFIDCQAQAIGETGYQALSAPGSTLSLVLTGLLTLFVAFFGYRMLFGQTPGVREGVLALVKIGIVLALATGWPAYRTLIYDVALKGPAELVADVGVPAGLPGAGGGLVGRLDYADGSLVALAVAGTGETVAPAGTAALPDAVPQPLPGFDTLAIGSARMIFLTAAIAAMAGVRLVAGLLLALGPFFIAFLLFDGTRGLFEGWVRVLAGTFLGALGTAVMLGVELALIEPWLADLLAQRAAGLAIPGAPTELLVVTLVFALALLAMLIATARAALGFRLPEWRSRSARLAAAIRSEQPRVAALARDGPMAPAEGRSRAAAVVDALAASQRRETAFAGATAAAAPGSGAPSRHKVVRDMPAPAAPVPLGQSFRRRTGTRVSPSAGRRDRPS